ncbi:hypothetical protein [Paenibacillus naphthalenovorans]|uniref:hypothetical protein n=1 Tax=Paenibacillus naphthalenovorans TaxID=162209 RepID=UPI000A410424|nr:hypothetical protein [Paenibacillus naphthalenovorans]
MVYPFVAVMWNDDRIGGATVSRRSVYVTGSFTLSNVLRIRKLASCQESAFESN